MAFFLVIVLTVTTLIPSNVVFAQDVIESDESQQTSNQYQVFFSEVIGGSIIDVNADIETSVYEEGQKVTLQIIPEKGYELGYIQISNDGNGSFIETSEVIDSKVSFIMPGSNVTVSGEFINSETITEENNSLNNQEDSSVIESEAEETVNEDIYETEESTVENNIEETDLTDELFSFVKGAGSISVGLSVGGNCNYGSYNTRYYKDTTNNNAYAYCAQPSKDSPAGGTYTASVANVAGLKAILYYGYGGPGFNDPVYGAKKIFDFSDAEISKERIPYAYTHTMVALAYYGGNWDAMGSSIQQGMVDLKSAFLSVYDFYKDKDSTVPSGFTAYLFSTGGATQIMATWRYVPNGKLNLKKTSANPTLTDGNSCYSFEGAKFGVYTEESCTNQVGTLTANASGDTNTIDLEEKTYWVKELVAPKGYALNSQPVPVVVSAGQTATVSFADVPQSDPVGILLGKIDKDTNQNKPQGSGSLANAEFTVKFYEGYYDTDPAAQGKTAIRTWVLKTNNNGYVDLTYKISGDDLWYNSNGVPTLPLGTITIQETKAPEGYLLNDEVYVRKITSNGNFETVNTYNQPTIPEQAIRGGVKICKRDYETGEAAPQGGATLGNAQFDIITLNENTVVVEGQEYSKGQVVKTIATNPETNIASTEADTLPAGDYKMREAVPPNGYLVDGAVEREFKITENGKIVDLTSKDKSIYNQVIRGDIELSKFGRLSDTSEETEMHPLPGIIFSVTSSTTGNVWYLVTNENGYADSKTQNVYSKIIKNSDGTISVDKNSVVQKNPRGCFPYDTYTIRELNTPKGYMPINDITFRLTSDGYKYQWILEDKNVMSAVRIVKTDAETGKTIPVAGVTFKIYDKDMKQLKLCVSHYPQEQYAEEFTTDETGTFVLPEKLQVGTYYLEEISTPEGYLFGGILQFEIEEGRDWAQPVEICYPNENVKGRIKLAKTDSLYGDAVEGAVYGVFAREDVITNDGTLRYSADEKVDTMTTDKQGESISKELYLGKYYLKELETPDKYKLDETEYDVELKYKDGKTPVVYTSLEVEDEPNTIYIIKRDSKTKEPLLGATLQLLNMNGDVVDEWVSEEEPHEITKLADEKYVLHEKEVPKGYNIADDMEIELKGGIETEVITMDDVPIQTTFEKFDALDEENSLTGATYQLINSEGDVVDEWITEGKPYEIYAPEAGEYTVHEVKAPEGYDIHEDYQIVVTESKDIQTFQMKDNPIQVQIDKKSSDTGESLIGATLQLIDKDGNIVDEWVTDGKPHEIYAPQQGTYTLHEKEAPEGYATAPDMTIEIKQTNEVQSFTMEDDPIIINVSKIEGDGKKDLAGATLQLIDKDGNIVDEWITDGKPHETRNVPKGNYILHEEKAPDGYALAADMEIEIKDSNEIQYFTMTDKKIGSIVTSMRKGANTPDGSILTKMGRMLFAPKTGDSTNILSVVILLVVSISIILICVYRSRKRKLLAGADSKSRKRAIKRKSILFLLMVSTLTLNCNNTVFAKNKSTDIIKEYEYVTSDKTEKSGTFEKEIKEGKHKYSLKDVKYQIQKSVPLMETEEVTKTVESGLIDKSDTYSPEDTITEDGITYTLADCSVIDGSEYTKTYTAHYNYLETDTTIPENKIIGVTDENGNSVQINGKLSGTESLTEGKWLDTSMSITFDHYDTGIFNWQGQTINLNSDNPLQGYSSELLQSVGADTNTNRVVSTEWSGEPYEVDGVVYRNATANVQYFVPYVSATYTGTIDYVKYQSTYTGTQNVESTENYTYLMKAKATYSMENTFSVAQIVIFATIGIAILAVLVVLILSVISKRKKEENQKKDYQNYRRRKC